MGAPLVRRNVAAHLGRGVLLTVVVVMATTFVVGSLAFSRHVETLLGATDAAAAGAASVSGTVTVAPDLGGATTTTALSDELVDVAAAVPGVATASGTFDQPVLFEVDRDEQPDRPVQLRGLVFSSAFDASWELLEGRAPQGPEEIAADLGGLAAGVTFLGDVTDLQLPTGTAEVRVVGLARRVGSAPPVGAAALADAHAIFDPAVIADLLAANGSFDRLTVVPDGTVAVDEVIRGLRRALPDGLVVTELTTALGSTQQTVSAIDDSVRQATGGFAVVSFLVAVLVIANVWSVVVAQRTRELGLLRLLGASRRQVLANVVAEAAVIGVVGAVIGAPGGAWLGRAAAGVVAETDAVIPLRLDVPLVVTALVVGVGVTVIGSLGSARRASTVPPLAALSEGWSTPPPRARWRRLLPAVATAMGLVAVLRWRAEPTAVSTTLGALGALGLVLGAASWSRAAVRPLLAVVDRGLRSAGPISRMAGGNTRRDPRRTAAAASTLIVGMTLVASIATAGASVRTTLSDQFSAVSRADFFVERRGLVRVDAGSLFGAINARRIPLTAAAAVIAVDGVVAGPGGVERRVVTTELTSIASIVDLDVAEGSLGDDGPGVALSRAAARRLDAGLGDTVELTSVSGRSTPVPVVALYRDTAVFGHVIVDRASVGAVDAEGTFELLALSVDERFSERDSRRQLERVARDFPRVRVHDPVEFDELNTAVADTVLRIVSVLLAASLAMGAIGLSATIALSVIERRRELALLRVVGAQREDLTALVRAEALLIALAAGAVGLVVGVGVATAALLAAPAEVAQQVVVPWALLGAALMGAALLGVLAAIGPARRASSTSPLDALRAE